MLTLLGNDLWIADGPVVTGAMGFHFPTRMVVIRLDSGALFVWSPVALSPALRAAIDALGPVGHVIAPNSLHHGFIAPWHAAYPDAELWGAPGVSAAHPDLVWSGTLGTTAPAPWAGEIDQCLVGGNTITSEVVFFHRPSRTVIFTDLLQHLPRDWYRGWRALIARLDLMTASEPSVPRKFRVAFKDRQQARRAVDTILSWPIETVVMAHGAPVRADGHALVSRAFGWLRS